MIETIVISNFLMNRSRWGTSNGYKMLWRFWCSRILSWIMQSYWCHVKKYFGRQPKRLCKIQSIYREVLSTSCSRWLINSKFSYLDIIYILLLLKINVLCFFSLIKEILKQDGKEAQATPVHLGARFGAGIIKWTSLCLQHRDYYWFHGSLFIIDHHFWFSSWC